jgi:DNA-binding NarL/FixJ family response regulator
MVVSTPGPSQDGLLALLTTLPTVGVVLVAETAESAVRLVETHQPKLVILDMTDFSESGLIRELKSRRPEISVIALVGAVAAEERAEMSGVEVVLIKGFQPGALAAAVEEGMRVRRSRGPGTADSARPADSGR